MRVTVDYPIGSSGYDPDFLAPATVARFAQTLEELGYDAVSFTEHPAPSRKWLAGGGHETFDPLTALAFCAAVTTRLRLMTLLLVLPYRNPLLAAKQIATADVLSGGRTTIAVGAGYLRSEFAALGVDFDERNALVDEALHVLTSLWEGDTFSHDGRHFTAVDQVSLPAPVQRPHPPLWLGGNSRTARERVARHGQGWAPIVTAPQLSTTTRTAALETLDDLRAAVADLRERVTAAGRDPAAVDVQVQWPAAGTMTADPAAALDALAALAAAGATWVCLNPPATDAGRCFDTLAAFAADVLPAAHAL